MRTIPTIIIMLFFASCERHETYKLKANNNCHNLELYAARLFPNEEIQLELDGRLILREKIKDSVKGFKFLRKFCLPYTQKFTLSVKTIYNGKIYIDTALVGYNHKYGYHLNISMPTPTNWIPSHKDSIPLKKWGYLPIDSCVRFISFKSDSSYKNHIKCGVSSLNN